MATITPTPGRVVWYQPSPTDGLQQIGGAPLAAIVAGVQNDALINLAVFDANGATTSRTDVLLLDAGATPPEGQAYAQWMPYQIGQANAAASAAPVAAPAAAAAPEQTGAAA